MKYFGSIFIIAAASGTGKTTLATAVNEAIPDTLVSISHTTRPMRTGDREGNTYFFVDDKTFANMVDADKFLEHAKVFGYSYGTSRDFVLRNLEQGKDIILDIDWQGAQKVRKALSDLAVSIFLLPPSREALQQRLMTRSRDPEEIIADRMAKAHGEMVHYKEFDYLIINDNFEQALQEIKSIIQAQRLKCERQANKYASLIKELLQNQ
ncbi:MAG: guanylate kinase [Gammaproteobacteria bacterium]